MGIGLSLIALVLGYKLFVEAHKEKEGLKILGQVIGIFVMIAAFLAVLCGTMKCMAKAYCPMDYNKANCPISRALCAMKGDGGIGSKMNCPVGGKSDMPMRMSDDK